MVTRSIHPRMKRKLSMEMANLEQNLKKLMGMVYGKEFSGKRTHMKT